MTLQTQAVLQAFLDADRELYGLEISQASGLAAGTIYPILQRLDVAGWVRSRWENDGDAHAERRPPRRYYQLLLLHPIRLRYPLHIATVFSNRYKHRSLPLNTLRSTRLLDTFSAQIYTSPILTYTHIACNGLRTKRRDNNIKRSGMLCVQRQSLCSKFFTNKQ